MKFHCCLELVFGKVVISLPITYTIEGKAGMLYPAMTCRNMSEDGNVTYNLVWDAEWYRLFPNGTAHQLEETTSSSFDISQWFLMFRFVRREDQGDYYCCKPNGPCSGNSTVIIAGMYIHMNMYI